MYGTLTISFTVREITTTPDRPERTSRKTLSRQHHVTEEEARHIYKRFKFLNPELDKTMVEGEWKPNPISLDHDEW